MPDSALYFQYEGKYLCRGRSRIYWQRINTNDLRKKYFKSYTIEDNYRVCIYQIIARHKKFPDPLNVVIMIKTHLKTGKKSHIILFSSDLTLAWDELVEYYRLRFQIEFNFRDAKQYWGLEDFMVTYEQAVYSFANLSLCMVNVSQALLALSENQSVLDLKARYHVLYYTRGLLKILPKTADEIIIEELLDQIPVLGATHDVKMAA